MGDKSTRDTVKDVGRNIEPRTCRGCGTTIKSGVYCDDCLEARSQS